jgi:hypothetical protein
MKSPSAHLGVFCALLIVAVAGYISPGIFKIQAGTGISVSGGGVGEPFISLATPVSVVNGGLGVASPQAHAVLLGAGSSPVNPLSAPAATGQLLTSNGASADPSYQDPITSNTASNVLNTTFTLNTTNGTFQDTGLSVTLSSAGTYEITAMARAGVQTTVGSGYVTCKLSNSTDGTDIPNSERICTYGGVIGQLFIGNCTSSAIYNISASKIIKLLCCRNGATTYTTSEVESNSDGRTVLNYVQINYH